MFWKGFVQISFTLSINNFLKLSRKDDDGIPAITRDVEVYLSNIFMYLQSFIASIGTILSTVNIPASRLFNCSKLDK